jgi:fatty-acyl-CoA synthase
MPKDMIIRGGENIYPREIEEFLYTHPKIADVQVIGVPDKKYGEQVCAWIRLREGQYATADEIRDYCRGQVATYKIPHYIRFTAEFPMTVTGKDSKVPHAGRDDEGAWNRICRISGTDAELRRILRF